MLLVPTLIGKSMALEPLTIEHVPYLVAAASQDRSTFGFTVVPDGIEEMAGYVQTLLSGHQVGQDIPFVQRRVNADSSLGDVVGCTRFMNILFPLGRTVNGVSVPDEIEIGGTWLSKSAQRTSVNTEAKLLLMTHAFDTWGVQRVAICTDERNEQSRRAIERIGGVFEGVLRSDRPSWVPSEKGLLRNTAVYSVVSAEWPRVKSRLTTILGASSF
jgi:RimJ/RimL family protein N-acetyltransferase